MDLEARSRWVDYSKARDVILGKTSPTWAPWHVVDMNDKRAGRLNLIAHLLSQIPYDDLTPPPLDMPERQPAAGYVAPDWSRLDVPRVYE